ncbi:unnamed protein product [Schistocephalus solidus]|uniref:RGS domain-containing protein n=1 Tax=Schistocephalus solidus TaxID=70667 RepID=A0A183SR52_SCHSO|nr:unnamed protein product [Schistocephalus solidus]
MEETNDGMRPRETPTTTSSANGGCYINATISAFLPNTQTSMITEPSSETALGNNKSWESYDSGGGVDEGKGNTDDDGTETRHSSRRWLSLSSCTNGDWHPDIEWQKVRNGTWTKNEIEENSGEELIDELPQLGERQKMCIQQIKEFLLADREGMQDFLRFLLPTKGINLVKFWMDCEAILTHIKDHLSDKYLAEHVQDVRTLERTYESFLPRSTHALVLNAVTCFSRAASTEKMIDAVEARETEAVVFLGCANLDRAQYAALRRLRSYWLPRWMLHWEQRLLPMQLSPNPAWLSTAVDLSAGNEEIVALSVQCDVSAGVDGNRRELARQRLYPPPRSTLSWDSEDSFRVPKPIVERNLDLLPFLCRLVLAWSLPSDVEPVVTLLSDGSIDWKRLQAHLPRERTWTLARIANQAQINSFYFIEKLLNLFTSTYCAHAGKNDIAALSWVLLNQFIKPAAKFGLGRASRRHLDPDEPPDSPDVFDLFVEAGRIVARVRVTSRGMQVLPVFNRVAPTVAVTKINRQLPRTCRIVHGKLDDYEFCRKKIFWNLLGLDGWVGRWGSLYCLLLICQRPSKLQQRHAKWDHKQKSEQSPENADEWSLELTSVISEEAPVDVPQLHEVLTNNQLLLLFQMDLTDTAGSLRTSRSPEDNQQLLDFLVLLLKITDFLALPNPESRPELTRMRSARASEIRSTFLSSIAQKLADLPHNLRQLLEKDKEHPKTSVLQSLQQHLIDQLNQPFVDWIKVRSAEAGMSPRSFTRLRGNQLFEPSRVTTAGMSKVSVASLRNGASAGRPFAENDLIFYIESLRFKAFLFKCCPPSYSHFRICDLPTPRLDLTASVVAAAMGELQFTPVPS